MKHLLTCLLAMLGLTSACGQKNYEDVDVKQFAEIIADTCARCAYSRRVCRGAYCPCRQYRREAKRLHG